MPELIYYAGIGSRETPKDVCAKMTKLAKYLAERKYILRSGGAEGADLAFEKGVWVQRLKEIYLPWKGFNDSKSELYTSSKEAEEIAIQFHPRWHLLKSGGKKLQTRNVHQVLGKDLKTPSKFVICWTSDGKASGGTGQAIRIANAHQIPVFNLYNLAEEICLKTFLEELAT